MFYQFHERMCVYVFVDAIFLPSLLRFCFCPFVYRLPLQILL